MSRPSTPFSVTAAKTLMPACAGMTTLIVAALALATPARAQQGDATRGEQKFVECAACHSVERGVNNVGPSLAGIFSRQSGSLAFTRK